MMEKPQTKVIVFGIGKNFANVKDFLFHQFNVIAIVDNNQSKWGNVINKVEVISPEKIKHIEYDKIIVTPPPPAGDEIIKQLKNMGVAQNKIESKKLIINFTELDDFVDKYKTAANDWPLYNWQLRQHALSFSHFCKLFGSAPPSQNAFSNEYREWEIAFFEFLSGRKYDYDNEGITISESGESIVLTDIDFCNHPEKLEGMTFNRLSPVAPEFFDIISPKASWRILDMGCGRGELLEMFGKKGCTVVGVDVSKNDLMISKWRLKHQNIDGQTVCCSFYDIHTIAGTFDLIIFNSSFHHCGEPVRLLETLHTKLSPGGKIIFTHETISPHFDRPWGVVRYDGLSILHIRMRGWLEFGYRSDFFEELLSHTGWKVSSTHQMSDFTIMYQVVLSDSQ